METAAARNPVAASSAPLGGTSRPAMPSGIAEFFLPQNITLAQACQSAGRPRQQMPSASTAPRLLAQAKVRFLERKYGVDHQVAKTALVIAPDPRGVVRWQDYPSAAIDESALQKSPIASAGFAALEPPLSDGKLLKALEKDFQDWAYHESSLKVTATPCTGATGPQAAIDKKLDALRRNWSASSLSCSRIKPKMTQRTIEEVGTAADNIFGMLHRPQPPADHLAYQTPADFQGRRRRGRIQADDRAAAKADPGTGTDENGRRTAGSRRRGNHANPRAKRCLRRTVRRGLGAVLPPVGRNGMEGYSNR